MLIIQFMISAIVRSELHSLCSRSPADLKTPRPIAFISTIGPDGSKNVSTSPDSVLIPARSNVVLQHGSAQSSGYYGVHSVCQKEPGWNERYVI